MKVQFVQQDALDGHQIASLSLNTEYEVIGIEADAYRIINNRREPCLYDPSHFVLIDTTEPSFWICLIGDEGERYCYPKPWLRPGFFEDYFEGQEEVTTQFWHDYRMWYT